MNMISVTPVLTLNIPLFYSELITLFEASEFFIFLRISQVRQYKPKLTWSTQTLVVMI